MSTLRLLHLRSVGHLGRWVLLWFMLSLGVAMASPIVNPSALDMVCSSAGMVKVVVQTDDGVRELGAVQLDCPMCMPTGTPPPITGCAAPPLPQALRHVLEFIASARIATDTAAPPLARGPPLL
ncbi:hypothetical protein [Ottowia thiooxydans]|uniref:hypothetical protein n=1 Tax=Ottowia thiooxydans TaxID=219182 RepID=UPI0004914522|nr:hypothetical protein [Ottowia thiooxydans]